MTAKQSEASKLKRDTTNDPAAKAKWRPWGLYDQVRPISSPVLDQGARLLGISDDKAKTVGLAEHLGVIALNYWRLRRQIERPGPKFHSAQIKPVQKATARLLKVIRNGPKGMASAALEFRAFMDMQRRVRGTASAGDQETVEQFLRQFERVCQKIISGKGSAGAPAHGHVKAAARSLSETWASYTGKSFPINLAASAEGRACGREFTSPGPYFVQLILQDIDPELTVAQIATAIRTGVKKKTPTADQVSVKDQDTATDCAESGKTQT